MPLWTFLEKVNCGESKVDTLFLTSNAQLSDEFGLNLLDWLLRMCTKPPSPIAKHEELAQDGCGVPELSRIPKA